MENQYRSVKLPVINENRKYWMVRSNGGKYYDSFTSNDYVGISWDKIDSIFLSNKEVVTASDIEEFYKPKDDKKRVNYSLIAGQINKFNNEMKPGDIVITPSKDSKYIAFGRVLEEHIYFAEEKNVFNAEKLKKEDMHFCPHLKRRKIQWLTNVKKDQLDPKLFKMFFTHLTVSEIKSEEYIPFIDRTIDAFFIKGNQAHIVLRVNQKEKIQADLLAEFIGQTLKILDNEYNHVNNTNRKNIDIKLNVQSPGPVEFIGPIQDILLMSSIIFSNFVGFSTLIKLSGDGNDSEHPNLEETLEAVNNDNMEKYEGSVDGQFSELENLSRIFGELEIEDPSQNINSSKGEENKKNH
jgi:restriction system protein